MECGVEPCHRSGLRLVGCKRLSALQVRQENVPGRYTDGNGLYLVVDKLGAKRWLVRKVINGRRRDIGLGSVRLISLVDARMQTIDIARAIHQGRNPLARRTKTTSCPTFEQAARKVHLQRKSGWKNGKHADQWLTTLITYAFPILGDMAVSEITRPDVLRVLEPIWISKAETARRVLQRISTIMDWAEIAGHRSGICPTRNLRQALPRQSRKERHFVALPYEHVPDFIIKLETGSARSLTRLAFEFLILTACRSGEVRGCCWDEIDLKAALWTIPSERMKADAEHVVPLVPRTIALLEDAKRFSEGNSLVFPNNKGQMLSDMVFTKRLRDMGLAKVATAHGFRSSFRDWAAECTTFPPEVCEMALAHKVASKVERAYRRGNLLAKRRELMAAWTLFVCGECASGLPKKLTSARQESYLFANTS